MMMSSANFPFLQATTHPFLAAITGNQYDNNIKARGTYRRPHSNYKTPYRHLAAAGTNIHESYSNEEPSGYSSGHSSSGYGQPYPPVITSPHSASGSGYGSPHIHQPPPPAPFSFSFGKIKKGRNSAMTALTLLSFFFFVNLLQSCLKEHMNTINPTIMVMTSGVRSNRHNKLAEMNSREQSTSPASTASVDAHIVLQPEDVISAAVTAAPVPIVPIVTIQSPYISSTLQQSQLNFDNQLSSQNLYGKPSIENKPNSYDMNYNYPNRSLISPTTFLSTEKYDSHYNNNYNDRYHAPHHTISDVYPWSYGDNSETTFSMHNHYNSPTSPTTSTKVWTSSYYGSNNYYDRDRDRDRYDDAYYTRIN